MPRSPGSGSNSPRSMSSWTRLVEKNGDIRNSQGLTHAELDWLERKYGGEKSNAEVAEEFFFNAFAARSVLAGVRYDSVSGYGSSVHISTGLKDGFALFLTNEREVFVVEVEYEAQEKDLRYLLDVQGSKLPDYETRIRGSRDPSDPGGVPYFRRTQARGAGTGCDRSAEEGRPDRELRGLIRHRDPACLGYTVAREHHHLP